MSRQLTLTIRSGGTDYVYGPDRLLVQSDTLNRRVRGLDIEMEDIPLEIGPSPGGGNQGFLGQTDPTSVPDQTLRAKLEDASGTILMNGAITGEDVVYRQDKDSWILRLIDQAGEDFWSLLEDAFWSDPNDQLFERSFDAYQRRNGGIESVIVTWYQIRDVLVELFRERNIDFSLPNPLWEYEVDYKDASFTYDSSEVFVNRPGGTDDKTFVEEISKLAGYRVRVTYQGFPSSDLKVDFRPTSWPAPAASSTLDGEEEAEGYEVTIDRNTENWALALSNNVGASQPDARSESYDSTFSEVKAFGLPPSWGVLAPQSWRAAPPDEGAVRTNLINTSSVSLPTRKMYVDREETELQAPPMVVDDVTTNGAGTEKSANGKPLLDTVEEDGVLTPPDQFYVATTGNDPDSDSIFNILFGRYPTQSEYDGSKDIAHAPHWATGPYQSQPMQRETLRKAEGPFIKVPSEPVGDPSVVVELLSEKWQPFESERDLDSKITDYTLKRPVSITTKPDRPDRPSSDSDWEVMKPRAEYQTFDRGSGKEDWLIAHWKRSPLQDAEEVWYETYYRDNRENSPSWTLFDQADSKTFATSAVFQFETAGNGGKTISQGDIEFRVRPHKGVNDHGAFRVIDVEQP